MIAYTNYVTDGRVRFEVESLVDWGYEVLFLVPKEGPAPRAYVLCGVEVKELNVRKYQGQGNARYLLSYLTFLVLAFLACSRLFIQSRITAVHVHNMPNFLVFAGFLPRIFGTPLILDIHDTVPETYAAKFGTTSRLIFGLLQLEERICCWLAHRIVCVNHVQREAVVRRGIPPDKIITIITLPRFISQRPVCYGSKQTESFRLVNHGTISKRLGNDLIVEAAARLVHEIPGFELHFIGAGDGLDEVVRLSKSLGIENHVHFHRVVPWDALPKELAPMDAGIVANRRNVATELMLPVKLIDYITLGIPAVVPKLKGLEYYFSSDMVSYFEPGNVNSMVDAILRLYQDRGRQEQQAQAARAFLNHYGWDKQQKGLRDLYENL